MRLSQERLYFLQMVLSRYARDLLAESKRFHTYTEPADVSERLFQAGIEPRTVLLDLQENYGGYEILDYGDGEREPGSERIWRLGLFRGWPYQIDRQPYGFRVDGRMYIEFLDPNCSNPYSWVVNEKGQVFAQSPRELKPWFDSVKMLLENFGIERALAKGQHRPWKCLGGAHLGNELVPVGQDIGLKSIEAASGQQQRWWVSSDETLYVSVSLTWSGPPKAFLVAYGADEHSLECLTNYLEALGVTWKVTEWPSDWRGV